MSKTENPKIILITGCSSGFGLLTSARLASRGHTVISTMRNLNKQDDLNKEVRKRGGEVEIIKLDVTDNNSINEAFKEVESKHGYLDVLVNNAGFGMGGFFEDLSEQDIRDQMETNFFGVQNVTRKAIPLLKRKKRGKIINISSVSGFSSSPCFSAYCCSKWALEAFSECLRFELKMFEIDVLLVEPGTYKTKIFFDNSRYAKDFNNEKSEYYNKSQKLNSKVLDYVNKCNKDPEDVANLIEKLINAKHPRFRNIPDFQNKILYFIRKFLPFGFFNWFMDKVFIGGLDVED